MRTGRIIFLLSCVLWAVDAAAQSTPAIDGPAAPVPPAVITRGPNGQATIRAIKLTSPLKVDGQLDEEVYAREKPFGGFLPGCGGG